MGENKLSKATDIINKCNEAASRKTGFDLVNMKGGLSKLMDLQSKVGAVIQLNPTPLGLEQKDVSITDNQMMGFEVDVPNKIITMTMKVDGKPSLNKKQQKIRKDILTKIKGVTSVQQAAVTSVVEIEVKY